MIPTLLLFAASLVVAGPIEAANASTLLEKALYTEQTVGDLDAAIALYAQIIDDEGRRGPHAAQAQYHLGLCLLKQGSTADANDAFDTLIRTYPDQASLVAQARQQLAAAPSELTLDPAPWADGEFLTYHLGLPTGRRVGILFQMAHAVQVDGEDTWQLEVRRLVANNADNYGVSRVLVNPDSQRPLRSMFRHGLLGNADVRYETDGVVVSRQAGEHRLAHSPALFDNEQALHLLRTLPLEPGYRAELSLLLPWTGEATDAVIEVTDTEPCEVPAGAFECHVVKLDMGKMVQTLWYTTSPERYLARVEASGVLVELAEIGRIALDETVPFGMDDFGFGGSLPAGWLLDERRSAERVNSALIRFLDPEAAVIAAVEINRCQRCPGLVESTERELEGAIGRFEGFAMRDGSWTERAIGGRAAISFIGDYVRNGEPWVQYRLYTFIENVRLEFIFRTPVGRFEQLRPTLDAIAESVDQR